MSTDLSGGLGRSDDTRFCSQTTQEDGNFSGPVTHSRWALHLQIEVRGRQMVTNRIINQWQAPASDLSTLSPKTMEKKPKNGREKKKGNFPSWRVLLHLLNKSAQHLSYLNCKKEGGRNKSHVHVFSKEAAIQEKKKKKGIHCKLHSLHTSIFSGRKTNITRWGGAGLSENCPRS